MSRCAVAHSGSGTRSSCVEREPSACTSALSLDPRHRPVCGRFGHCLGKPHRIFMRAFRVAADANCASGEPQAALVEPPFGAGSPLSREPAEATQAGSFCERCPWSGRPRSCCAQRASSRWRAGAGRPAGLRAERCYTPSDPAPGGTRSKALRNARARSRCLRGEVSVGCPRPTPRGFRGRRIALRCAR